MKIKMKTFAVGGLAFIFGALSALVFPSAVENMKAALFQVQVSEHESTGVFDTDYYEVLSSEYLSDYNLTVTISEETGQLIVYDKANESVVSSFNCDERSALERGELIEVSALLNGETLPLAYGVANFAYESTRVISEAARVENKFLYAQLQEGTEKFVITHEQEGNSIIGEEVTIDILLRRASQSCETFSSEEISFPIGAETMITAAQNVVSSITSMGNIPEVNNGFMTTSAQNIASELPNLNIIDIIPPALTNSDITNIFRRSGGRSQIYFNYGLRNDLSNLEGYIDKGLKFISIQNSNNEFIAKLARYSLGELEAYEGLSFTGQDLQTLNHPRHNQSTVLKYPQGDNTLTPTVFKTRNLFDIMAHRDVNVLGTASQPSETFYAIYCNEDRTSCIEDLKYMYSYPQGRENERYVYFDIEGFTQNGGKCFSQDQTGEVYDKCNMFTNFYKTGGLYTEIDGYYGISYTSAVDCPSIYRNIQDVFPEREIESHITYYGYSDTNDVRYCLIPNDLQLVQIIPGDHCPNTERTVMTLWQDSNYFCLEKQ